eukprot:13936700-Alexandrium_andersonii.AAC.1
MGHRSELLSAFDPEYWAWCFTELFCWGDCPERVWKAAPAHVLNDEVTNEALRRWYSLGDGHVLLSDRKWAKANLTRADEMRWRAHVSYKAVAFG